jgi:hypothetical protein
VLRGGGTAAQALAAGLPWASDLLTLPELRRIPAQDREDIVQEAWLLGLAEAAPWDLQEACLWLRDAVCVLAQSWKGKSRADRERGAAWEEARGSRGVNEWP